MRVFHHFAAGRSGDGALRIGAAGLSFVWSARAPAMAEKYSAHLNRVMQKI